MSARFYVWVHEKISPTQFVNPTFFTGKQFMANRVNAREYESFKGALLGLRAANRLLDQLYTDPYWRNRWEAEAVEFEWSDSWGGFRPSRARTAGYKRGFKKAVAS